MINDYLLTQIEEIEKEVQQREREKRLANSQNTKPLPLTFVTDTREQVGHRYIFNAENVVKTLPYGDYSIVPYEHKVSIERKEINDLVNTLIRGKQRFYKELTVLSNYEKSCILVEANYSHIINHYYTSRALPQSIEGLAHSTSYRFQIPVFYVDNFDLANRFAQNYLHRFYCKKANQEKGIKPELHRTQKENLAIEKTIIQMSLENFIKQVIENKEDFKNKLGEIQDYSSRAIVIESAYSNLVYQKFASPKIKQVVENIIFSLIVDYSFPVYFLESKEIANRWIKKYLKRYNEENKEVIAK